MTRILGMVFKEIIANYSSADKITRVSHHLYEVDLEKPDDICKN